MAFLMHAHQKIAKSIILISFIFGAIQNKTAFTQKPFKKLTDFICKVQWRDASYVTFNVEINWKCDRKGAAKH